MTYATKARRRALSLFERRRFLRTAAATLLRQRNASADELQLRGTRSFDREDGVYDALEPSGR
jgi:hypothetical protein